MKAHYLAAEKLPFDAFVALETEHHRTLVSGPEAAEAFRAFLEKRKPRFG
jgi:enoyl-CoA hydratase/carnithine racemase